ncbi:unnamed protein product [Brachionus calyciflorus]|uniref:Uncharacterized protein n=1 Tax=Brachionus calyciflorus TaxID=104777 RepID=A0A813N0A9_9BILA|nr:unnamed protein product [Brachionus calyciflorus]
MILETLVFIIIGSFASGNYIQRPVYNRPLYPPPQPPPLTNFQPPYQQPHYVNYPLPQQRPVPIPLPSNPVPIHQLIYHLTTPIYKTPIDVVLKGGKCIDRTPHPQNPHQYISCLPDGDYVIMDCPDGLVFNKYLDRCDYNANEISPCVSQPCSHGGRCVELPDHKYKCECLKGFNGDNCEIAPDICAMNPCGPNGECHSMPVNSPIPFYCTCFDDRLYGLGCNRNSKPNPCHLSELSESYFKVSIDPALFIHCDGTRLHMKFCPRPLVFSTRDNVCDWESHEHSNPQSQSNTQPEQKYQNNNNLY